MKQSGHEWHKKLNNYVTKKRAYNTKADPCVYVFGKNEKRVIMITYVDDIILASESLKKLNEIKYMLKTEFEITDLEIKEILGIKIDKNELTGSIRLSQEKYTNELVARFNMQNAKMVSTPTESNTKISKEMQPLNNKERKEKPYRELIRS